MKYAFYVLFLAGMMGAQVYLQPASDEPIKDYSGQYVLVTRAWESCMVQSGDSVTTNQCWAYHEYFFPTMAEAVKDLQRECGPGWPCLSKNGFVGIYKLTPALTRDQAKFEEGDRQIPEHVESRTEHWAKWNVKP